MSDQESSEHADDLRQSSSKDQHSDTHLSTDGAISLFSSVLKNALEQQKINLINHIDTHFVRQDKSTGVSNPDFVFKREGNRIQHQFNTERSDKLNRIENLISSGSYPPALELVSEEKETLRKRNKIIKIGDKHGWDTVNEYLDSPLADDKDDATNLRTAIARATRKRCQPKPYERPASRPSPDTGKFATSASGSKFNPRNFFRGFSQFSQFDNSTGQARVNETGKCFYCNQPGHFARFCPFKGAPSATISVAPKEQAKAQ